jgi:tRNA-specific 2-thiouridylase
MLDFALAGKMSSRVFVALSGGVDSSLTAALLKEKGHEVSGISMRLWADSAEGTDYARRVCHDLGIPLHVLNFEPEFQNYVIDYFCEEYSRGRTPNPCLACNEKMKFGLLLKKALELGAGYLATGHYARIDHSQGRYRLLKGIDPTKDQSYFLYNLGQAELKNLLFPLGEYHKDEVRRMAAARGLPIYERGESQDVCFIPNGNYASFLIQRLPPAPGEIVDLEGKVVGKHQSIASYTIGQRQGLDIASPEPLYVLRIDAQTNTLVVGPEAELFSDTLWASNVNFISGKPLSGGIEVGAKIRYRSTEAKAVLSPQGELFQLRFQQPQRAITPGQAVVFYNGDEVLGGGIIDRAV